MAALNKASIRSGIDLQSAIHSQTAMNICKEQNGKRRRNESGNIKLFPTARGEDNSAATNRTPNPSDTDASTSRSSGNQADGQISVGNIQASICFHTFFF